MQNTLMRKEIHLISSYNRIRIKRGEVWRGSESTVRAPIVSSLEPPLRPPALFELRQDVHSIDEHHAFAAHGVNLQVFAHRIDYAARILMHMLLVREEVLRAEGEHGRDVFPGPGACLGG